MKNLVMKKIVLIAVLIGWLKMIGMAQEKYEIITFTTEDGAHIEGALFKAEGIKAVVLAHGAVFNKVSWYPLAEKLQQQGITALPIDFRGYGKSSGGSTGKKMYDVIGAVNYLRKQGYSHISIIGGSMGGAATLNALGMLKKPVDKAILLAPAGGPPVRSTATQKLFVVSQGERMYNGVKEIYEASAEPKKLKVYPGSAHAQHLFNTEHADDLTGLIISFLQE